MLEIDEKNKFDFPAANPHVLVTDLIHKGARQINLLDFFHEVRVWLSKVGSTKPAENWKSRLVMEK